MWTNCWILVSVAIFVDFQFFDFAVESAPTDAELLSGSGDIAGGIFKGLDDESMFGIVQIETIGGERKRGWGWGVRFVRGRGGGGGADACREIFEGDLATFCHDHAVFDGGAELADVARPVVIEDGLHGVWGESGEGFLIFFGERLEESGDEDGDIFFALGEEGEGDGDDAESEEEIGAEFFFADELFEIFIGGGDEADIDLDGGIAADAFEGAFFAEDAEEFDLGGGVNFADFVEEKRAAVGLFEAADAAFDGPGEGAAFVAEEFTFEELRGESGAVNGDEFGLGATAEGVEGLGD